MDRFFSSEKIIHTGNPIRSEILGFNSKKIIARKQFKIDASNRTILVVGGSLGALSINNAIANNIQSIMNLGVNLIWQTGEKFKIRSKECLLGINSDRVSTHTFVKEMDHAYAVSDIIISRAGAIAISELCCIGKPVILIPSPNVSENHQYKNAQSLVNKNAALLVEDSHANSKLVCTLKNLLNNEDQMVSLSSNIKKIAVTNAADKIAKIALGLVK